MMYLIALKWRSAINVASMRTFTSYEELKAHFGGVYDPKWYGWHVYEIFPDKEPRHLSAKENRELGIEPPHEKK